MYLKIIKKHLMNFVIYRKIYAKQGGRLFHFYHGLWYDPAGAANHLAILTW